ncbi:MULTISPECIES: CoA transferase [unclassified Blastococcus]
MPAACEEPAGPVYAGLRVVDLTRGTAGAIATMLLADAGAEVIRLDSPDDPFAGCSGYRVWHRGKRRAVLDPADPADLAVARELLTGADVVVETPEHLPAELDVAGWTAADERLVRCSITGYGDAAAHRGRPAVDALVAARTGLCWETRGVPGTTIGLLSGRSDPLADLPVPDGAAVGPDRDGPMATGIPWASNATAYLAAIAIAAALRDRELTGLGQHVRTSLLQGVLGTTSIAWQRAEHPDSESYLGWTSDPRAPKGFYRARDGRWFQQWVQLPAFMLADEEPPAGTSPRDAELRIETDYAEMVLLHHFHPLMTRAAGRRTAAEWERAAEAAGVPLEVVRSPEEALLDDALLADGCVAELPDAEHGAIRAVGSVIRLGDCPAPVTRGTAPAGADTAWVRAHARRSRRAARPAGGSRGGGAAPLAGVRVLDLGLAIAGPFGAQLLAALGADVVRVHPARDEFWMRTQYSHMSNRGKRSLALDLKDPRGLAVFHDLVRGADVVHHNMREAAARRLGVDSASLRAVNPGLVHCHTRGYEHGRRDPRPANDQTAAALCGTEWVDGGTDRGGTPIWPSVSLGDTGNGLLSALGVLQALYHRDRTGRGQLVDTSITYAHLLNASSAWVTPDGATRGARPELDAEGWGVSALQRIYPTAVGWLCLAVASDDQWRRLCAALPELDLPRFATAPGRAAADGELAERLTAVLATDTAEAWAARLDACQVPAEACAPAPGTALFDDPDLAARGLVTSYRHPVLGRMQMAGRLFDVRGVAPLGPAPLLGQHTRELLLELGRSPAEVDALAADGVVVDRSRSAVDA